MDLEELNKTQIILLTLLVSFVTSIATGIVTVTLMDQAPPAVTQTINRVVERTVERVVPAEPTEPGVVETVIEKETTVVVKEDDLITDSIEKNKQKIVRLVNISETTPEPVGTSTPEVERSYIFKGIGVIVSADGKIATAPSLATEVDLVAVTPNGVEHAVEVVTSDDELAILQVVLGEDEVISFDPVTLVDESTLKLGQTVISLGGEERTSVSTGIIASIGDGFVLTNMSGSIPGSPLVNIFGELVGIDVSGTPGQFIASGVISSQMSDTNQEANVLEALETAEEILDSNETTQIEDEEQNS